MREIQAIPKLHELCVRDNSSILSFKVEKEIPDLDLHFPNNTLIAAYLQLIWVEYLVEKTFQRKKIHRIVDVKFNSKITPLEEINVNLFWQADHDKSELLNLVKFSITNSNSQLKTQGKLEILNHQI